MQRTLISRPHLYQWITYEIQRRPGCGAFSGEFSFMRLSTPGETGCTWQIEAVTDIHRWTSECFEAFVAVVTLAQTGFDLSD